MWDKDVAAFKWRGRAPAATLLRSARLMGLGGHRLDREIDSRNVRRGDELKPLAIRLDVEQPVAGRRHEQVIGMVHGDGIAAD